jgi:hypothetical protein
MGRENESPGALAGAHRADVTMLAGKDDVGTTSPSVFDLQVRLLLTRYALSAEVANVVAEHAFSTGRRP